MSTSNVSTGKRPIVSKTSTTAWFRQALMPAGDFCFSLRHQGELHSLWWAARLLFTWLVVYQPFSQIFDVQVVTAANILLQFFHFGFNSGS